MQWCGEEAVQRQGSSGVQDRDSASLWLTQATFPSCLPSRQLLALILFAGRVALVRGQGL